MLSLQGGIRRIMSDF